ncbi:MAG: hypothetical protein U0793_09605 [Gemmataceae bacterium]
MAIAHQPGPEEGKITLRFHHGTDQMSANDLDHNGVNQQHAAAWNGTGEFWATLDHGRAAWFALSHPSSPPAACFEFDLPEEVLQLMLQMNPPAALRHGTDDVEFLPPSHLLLNQHIANKAVVRVP